MDFTEINQLPIWILKLHGNYLSIGLKNSIMENKSMIESNHEIWHRCTKCGKLFDLWSCSSYCPNCGAQAASFLSNYIYAIAILLFLLIIR